MNIIISVNYDEILENLLESEYGWKRNQDYIWIKDKSEFKISNILEHESKKIILKLHGTHSDVNSIIGALDDVQGVDIHIGHILQLLLFEYNVLFIGYSMRDYDIFPFIVNFLNTNEGRKMYFVDPYGIRNTVSHIIKLNGESNMRLRYIIL